MDFESFEFLSSSISSSIEQLKQTDRLKDLCHYSNRNLKFHAWSFNAPCGIVLCVLVAKSKDVNLNSILCKNEAEVIFSLAKFLEQESVVPEAN